ncbi:MAG TPA: TonB-dependent receptor plug domain-containing protein [Candidatus Acidoferrales bacterium]|nr:TonB-dependent receptor plug domain-containing protein [Candidatus Acidoferrales bacterium]
MRRRLKLAQSLLILLFLGKPVSAQRADQRPPQNADLTSMSIQELTNIQVTSASKKVESLSAAPAAIYVITGEDIRRGGFSSVPDALRTVPGMYVVQQSSHVWLVTARGFSNEFNDKMLVLIDGRLVYSPTNGGVYWDVQDPPLEDIERIEVIRGPGGTLWGANAINGVINIITKDSSKTQGMLVAASSGVNEGYAGRVHFGGKIGENFAYRIYGTSNDWLPTVSPTGFENYDGWSITQGGMRFDWTASRKNTVTFDGQGYSGRIRDVQGVFSPTSAELTQTDTSGVVKGGHLLGDWKHSFSDRSSLDVLGYCDWTGRESIVLTEYRNTCDVEGQHRYSFNPRHTLTWGGSILTTSETWNDTFTNSFVPSSQRVTTYSAFLQYDVVLAPDKFRLIAGSKFEHNPYTGFEYQPQVRAVWTPQKQHTFWVAISRAVRTPDRFDEDILHRDKQINPSPPPPEFILFTGNPAVKSEVLIAFEAGYRYEWKQIFSLDAATFYNHYDHLIGASAPGSPIVNPLPFFVDFPVGIVNEKGGQTHGLEIFAKYSPVRRWTVSAGITELRGASPAWTAFPAVADNPLHEANVESKLDLTHFVNLDASYFYNDAIPHLLPTLNRVDVGSTTRPIRGFTFSVWGRNLQQDRHKEAIPLLF